MRYITRIASVALLAILAAAPALADTYPSKQIKFVVPYPPGGTADLLARSIGQQLSERLGQTVIVENRPGAGTAIGADAVAKSEPDGYTLFLGTVSSHAITPSVNEVRYDPVRDFTSIAGVASVPFILIVHPSVPAKSVAEFIALAKSKPGAINYASAGLGTSNHLAGELFASMAGVQMVHVPYRGSAPALNDVVAGHVQAMFDLSATALPHVRSNAVRALGIASGRRSEQAPELPTIAESGLPGFEVSAWFGVFGPAGMPPQVTARLHRELNALMATPQMRERLAQQSSELLVYPSPAAFADFVRNERDRWAKVVKDAKISAK